MSFYFIIFYYLSSFVVSFYVRLLSFKLEKIMVDYDIVNDFCQLRSNFECVNCVILGSIISSF